MPRYAELIRAASLKRKLIEAGRRITAIATDPNLDASDALEHAEQQLVARARRGAAGTPRHVADIGSEAFDRYAELQQATDKDALLGIHTEFHDLDHLLGGLLPGHLVIVAARPSMGKTSFALDVARAAAGVQKRNVAVFSLEMSSQELMDRIVAGYLGVEAWKLKKGQLSVRTMAPDSDRVDVRRSDIIRRMSRPRCARMTAINLGLRGRYGWVVCGNSLIGETKFAYSQGRNPLPEAG